MGDSTSAGDAVAFAGEALDDAVARVGPVRADRWSWRRDGPRLELRAADPDRARGDRLLLISAGSALLTVRVLLRARGVAVTALPFPEAAQPGLLAVVRVEGARVVTADDATLARMVLEPIASGPVPAGVPNLVLPELRAAARREQAWLAVVPAASGGTDRRWTAARAGDADAMVIGTVVIGTVLDGAAAHLQAGQAVQRVLLTAAVAGVSLYRASEDLFTGQGRSELRANLGGGVWPQVVLRTRVGGGPVAVDRRSDAWA